MIYSMTLDRPTYLEFSNFLEVLSCLEKKKPNLIVTDHIGCLYSFTFNLGYSNVVFLDYLTEASGGICFTAHFLGSYKNYFDSPFFSNYEHDVFDLGVYSNAVICSPLYYVYEQLKLYSLKRDSFVTIFSTEDLEMITTVDCFVREFCKRVKLAVSLL